MGWTTENIPSQRGKSILITGANAGLGFQTALVLARKGARVILAGRDQSRLDVAATAIRKDAPEATIVSDIVDLSSLNSIANFAKSLTKTIDHLDVLINNAGVMFPPPGKTVDGYETQFGTNHIGHFALTGLLFDLLKAKPGSRVVTLSSIGHRGAQIDFDNLKLEKPYDKFREYGQSKLANLLFAIELQRRIDRIGLGILSLGAHPGISKTELLRHDDADAINMFDYMDAAQGALPSLFAATSDDVAGGGYYGPDGEKEINGYPAPAVIDDSAKSSEISQQLWDYSELETGIRFP